ncbi:helix-turn-helix domain-containing protein [Streptosporangium sp. NPDC051022]|uniref:PucR family transcriptional regulator n=1 Tax=Streptosporangium sp. NPDC051022 TaxID=3155752 RepID=UPI003446742C
MHVITVSGLVEALGSTLLRPVQTGADLPVRDVVIAEPGVPFSPGDLLLGVGVTAEEQQALLDRASARPSTTSSAASPTGSAPSHVGATFGEPLAAGVALKGPITPSLVAPPGVAVVEVPAEVSWTRLLWLLRDLVGLISESGGDTLASLADDVAEVLDGPVTIEDTSGQVLAYSARQEPTDAGRISSIVGRRIPQDALARLRTKGVYRRLTREKDPIYVPSGPGGRLPRLVVPVRYGTELLGAIWTIVPGPVPPSRIAALGPTLAAVALQLLRLRAHGDAARRLLSDRLRTLLTGGTADLVPPDPCRVAAVRPADGLGDLLRRHGWRTPYLTSIDGVTYVLAAGHGDALTPGSWTWLRWVAGEAKLTVAAGTAVSGAAGRSRAQAAELLDLVSDGQITTYEEAWPRLVVKRAAAVPADLLLGGPLPILVAHDAAHGTAYVETLRAWLWEQGNPTAASARLHVHPNTFRYRMRRLLETAPCDLGSAEVRLALTLQLVTL